MGYTTSPLRYPGGKTRLAKFVKQVLIENNLVGGEYIEPYAGGAGIAWSLAFEDFVTHIHISDLSWAVYAFWSSVFEDTEALCQRIWDTPVTIETWNRERAIQENPQQHSLLDVGFSTFYLNRTNRSGIILGGVIGGKNQDGEWRLDARYNKDALVKRIERIVQYKEHVHLYHRDAVDFIQQVLPKLPARSLVYLDPPYYKKGSGLYEDHYKHEDHVAVSQLVATSVAQAWIVSYDDVPETRRLYEGFNCLAYQLKYSAADRYSGAEVMFFSPGLVVPEVESPLGVRAPRPPRRT